MTSAVLLVVLSWALRLVLRAPEPATPRSDEDLFAAYAAGDSSAFDELFARYAPALMGLMRKQVRKEEDARELVQQTFLQLHRARNDFRAGAALRPWLYTIALNLRREHFRRRARKPEDARELHDGITPRVQPVDVTRGETARQVRAALSRLPESQRLVIQLHWFDGLPFPEVASIVGASVSAVKVRAHRGYKRLRELLADLETAEQAGVTADGSGA